MIVGIGMDLVDIARVKKMVRKDSELLLQRLLTDREQAVMMSFDNENRRVEWVSGRFAAKEALLKAIGTGVSGQISMLDIEVLPDSMGRPSVVLSSTIRQYIGFPVFCHLTITHTASTAGAMIMVEREEHV